MRSSVGVLLLITLKKNARSTSFTILAFSKRKIYTERERVRECHRPSSLILFYAHAHTHTHNLPIIQPKPEDGLDFCAKHSHTPRGGQTTNEPEQDDRTLLRDELRQNYGYQPAAGQGGGGHFVKGFRRGRLLRTIHTFTKIQPQKMAATLRLCGSSYTTFFGVAARCD